MCFFYHSTILLLALSFYRFYCLRLLQFAWVSFTTIYLHTNALFAMQSNGKESSNQMNSALFPSFLCAFNVRVFASKWTKSKRSHLEMKNTNNNASRFQCAISKIADIKKRIGWHGWQFQHHFILNYRRLNSRSFIHSFIAFCSFFRFGLSSSLNCIRGDDALYWPLISLFFSSPNWELSFGFSSNFKWIARIVIGFLSSMNDQFNYISHNWITFRE